jgi:hypothetical protein
MNQTENRALAEWLDAKIGRDRRFKSARQLALAAELNQNAIVNIVQRGRAEPETLIKLARVLGESPVQLFILAGWLRPEDINPHLDVDEAKLLDYWRRTPAERRHVLLEVAELASP